MAEKIKDAQDRMLEALLATPPVADDGFSRRIVRRLQRRLWVRRLTLPVAAIIGGAIAFKPLTGLVSMLANLSVLLPKDIVTATTGSIPQLQVVVLGAILLLVFLLGMRFLED
ncbi:MAG TPA: hypothetical protein PKH39_07695 [Woeseiaceae bacterium]|nr:hypothetical protein [Woeseiaceae bacterium]